MDGLYWPPLVPATEDGISIYSVPQKASSMKTVSNTVATSSIWLHFVYSCASLHFPAGHMNDSDYCTNLAGGKRLAVLETLSQGRTVKRKE
jgi:hypothetical protein